MCAVPSLSWSHEVYNVHVSSLSLVAWYKLRSLAGGFVEGPINGVYCLVIWLNWLGCLRMSSDLIESSCPQYRTVIHCRFLQSDSKWRDISGFLHRCTSWKVSPLSDASAWKGRANKSQLWDTELRCSVENKQKRKPPILLPSARCSRPAPWRKSSLQT